MDIDAPYFVVASPKVLFIAMEQSSGPSGTEQPNSPVANPSIRNPSLRPNAIQKCLRHIVEFLVPTAKNVYDYNERSASKETCLATNAVDLAMRDDPDQLTSTTEVEALNRTHVENIEHVADRILKKLVGWSHSRFHYNAISDLGFGSFRTVYWKMTV
ncbi:hypothetical protein AJ80_03182 [Polytolypa hystricis UAMH7299]|uniref:Uncharacterized protein n=1 Tax=Polytolypa hystricis (strain UAMH7299) TaxID=1447883 RepID=A0A2B7YBR8_POLH7|nr:hypothetical protein AJ80_03182 [Polytolypa hystricis UAMH7299]